MSEEKNTSVISSQKTKNTKIDSHFSEKKLAKKGLVNQKLSNPDFSFTKIKPQIDNVSKLKNVKNKLSIQVAQSSFAGFWVRFLAYLVDIVLVSIVMLVISVVVFLSLSTTVLKTQYQKSLEYQELAITALEKKSENQTLDLNYLANLITSCANLASENEIEIKLKEICPQKQEFDRVNTTTIQSVNLIIFLLYFVGLPATKWQATVGKKLLKLKIVDFQLQKPGFLNLFTRQIFWFLSSVISLITAIFYGNLSVYSTLSSLSTILGLTILIDCLRIFFDPQKRSIHDNLAQTLVVKN